MHNSRNVLTIIADFRCLKVDNAFHIFRVFLNIISFQDNHTSFTTKHIKLTDISDSECYESASLRERLPTHFQLPMLSRYETFFSATLRRSSHNLTFPTRSDKVPPKDSYFVVAYFAVRFTRASL